MTATTEFLPRALARAVAVRPRVGGFPHFAEALRRSGVIRHTCTVPSATSVYELAAGPVVDQGRPLVAGVVDVPPFDEAALVAAIRADQAGATTYPQFVGACWAAGVLWYQVDFEARTCTYHGAAGGRYVEAYPAVDLP